MRVEVVPADEVQEKIMMTPGDVSMLLNETNGLRVQTTSPSLGGANVRIQGLRGRYTQILADGLPLYGGQTGSIGLLQIPPMDLGQVEVIKGVASALYGMSADRRRRQSRVAAAAGGAARARGARQSHEPRRHRRRQLAGGAAQRSMGLHASSAAATCRSGPISTRTAGPTCRCTGASSRRPRVFWDDGAGKSLLMTAGGMAEARRGGTMPGRRDAGRERRSPRASTPRADRRAASWRASRRASGRLVAARGSATAQHHTHTFGPVIERDRHRTLFGEVSVAGTAGRHTWVAGAALQRDRYRSHDVPRFDYAYTVPGVFAQDEFARDALAHAVRQRPARSCTTSSGRS